MKVKWFGHASFLITSDKGTKIITDPYTPGVYGLEYKQIGESADVVTMSHDHADHNNVSVIPGKPQILKGAGKHQAKGIEFRGIASCHDDCGGKERGDDTIFIFTVDDIKFCHLGDLGRSLTDKEASEIGGVDVLMIPIGGSFTIDAAGADKVIAQIKPRIVFPMHYQTDGCPNFPVANADPFLKGKKNVKKIDDSKIEMRSNQLPKDTQIYVLKHEL
jgi:L-ascorbate metabolism protein UlaG (beta-lactamase superfamily)